MWGTISFFFGAFLVLYGWAFIGMIVEIIGIISLFKNFFSLYTIMATICSDNRTHFAISTCTKNIETISWANFANNKINNLIETKTKQTKMVLCSESIQNTYYYIYENNIIACYTPSLTITIH